MKRLNLFVMCLFASLLVLDASAQEKKPYLGTSPMGLVSMSVNYPLYLTVLYRDVKDIKWESENVSVDTKSNMKVASSHDLTFSRTKKRASDKTPNFNKNYYYLTPTKLGPTKVVFSAVTDEGKVLKQTLVMSVGESSNMNLAMEVPTEIVKSGDSQSLKMNVGKDVKSVMVYISGQDKYYYEKASGGKVKFKLDLSDITKDAYVNIVAYDEEYKTNSYNSKVVVK